MIKGNYLKGLNGLTKQDRQNWEKQYSSLLQGKTYDNDQLNQLYLNTKFKEAFGNRSDYNTLRTLNYEDRNKMLEQYNRNVAFKQSFGNRKDYDKLKALPSQIRNQIQDEAYIQNYALDKYKNNPNLTDIMTLTPTSLEKLIDSGYKSEWELKKIEEARELESKKPQILPNTGGWYSMPYSAGPDLFSKITRRKNEELLSKIQNEDDKLKEKQVQPLAEKYYKELAANYDASQRANSQDGQYVKNDNFIFDFFKNYNNFAEQSNYYHAFKGDYTLNQKKQTDQQLRDYAKWQAIKDTYGEAAAIGYMDRDFQRTVADRQLWVDKVANSTKNIFLGAAADIANDVLFYRTAYILATQGKDAAAKYMQGLNSDGTKIKNKWDDPTYWQGVDQFNTTSRREIEDIRARGGISPYNNVVAPGEEFDLISMHTIDEAYKQSKHLLSGLIEGGVGGKTASLLGKGVSLASTKAGDFVGKTGHVLSYLNLGAGNAQLEGLNSFQEARQAALERIDDIIDSEEGQKEINAYVERVRNVRKKKAGENGKYIFDEETVRKEGEQLYRQMLEQEAERDAVDAWTATASIDFARSAATNFALKKYLLSKETREALKGTPKPTIKSNADGTLSVKEPQTRLEKALHHAKKLKYPFDEFQEEVVDNAVNNFGQGLALAEFNDYAAKTMNPTAYNTATDNFISHFLEGVDKATDALVDPQSYYEGFIGALSGGFGVSVGIDQLSNIGKLATKSGREELKKEMKEQTWAEKINNFIVNPIINDLAEENAAKRKAQKRVDLVNSLIKNKKESIDDLVSLITTSANIDEKMSQGDTKGTKDAKEDNIIATLNALNVLSRDEFGKQSSSVTQTLDNLNRLANGDISQEEINLFLGQSENKEMLNQEGSEQKAAERIQKNAQKALDIYQTMDNVRNTISEHPNANNLSSEAYNQLIYLGVKDKLSEDRINTMVSELNDLGISLNTGEVQHNPLTRYQTKSGYETEKTSQEQLVDRIQTRIDKVQQLINDKTESLTEEKSEENNKTKAEIDSLKLQKKDLQKRLNNAKEDLNQINKDAELFKDGDINEVITKDQMATLSPAQLLEMLDPVNLHKYNKKQQAIIEEFEQDLRRKSPLAEEKIADLYMLQLEKQFSNQTYDNILQNPELYDYYLNSVGQDYQNKIELQQRNNLEQQVFNLLDNTSDEELHNVAINTSVEALDKYIQKRPDRAPLIEQFKKVAQLREDAAAVIKDMDIPTDYKNPLRQSMINITESAKTQEEAINNLEDAIDSKEVDDTTKNALNQLLNKMQDLNYQRNATKVHTREVKKRRQEAARKAAETKKRKKQEKEAKDRAEVQQLLDKFDITKEDADAIDGDIIGVTDVQSPTKDSNGSATLRVRNGKKTIDKKVTLVNKQPKEQQKVLTPTGEESEVKLEGVESVDLGDLGETKKGDESGTKEIPQEAPKEEGNQPIVEKKEEKKEVQQEGQQEVKETPYGNETIVDGQVMVTSPTEQQLLSENTTGKVGTTETPKIDNTSDPSDDPNQTTLKGNKFFGYKGDQLKSKGEQLPNVDGNLNSVVTAIHQWLDSIGARVQDIIDSELNDIIDALKEEGETPKIQFLIVNENGKATQDDKLGNVVFNVIKYTDTVKRIHNSNLGGVIKAQDGQEYLIVGTLGYIGPNQSQSFFSIKDRLKINRNQSGNLNQRFYVDPNMYTQIAQIGRGWITRRLANDDGIYLRTISQLLNDTERNPRGLKLEDLKWGIQMLTQFATVNVSSRNTISSPYDVVANSGSVFLLVEASNGKLIPIKVEPVYYHEMRDSTIKRAVDNIINNQLLDLNYEVRRKAIGRLVSILSLNERNNILIGNEQNPVISIKQNGIVVKRFYLNDPMFNRAEFIKAIEESKFRVNITPNSLSTENYIKLLDEAGCLLVDIAKLGMSNADYSVYPVGNDGKPIIPTTTQNSSTTTTVNSDLQKTRYPSVRLFGSNYRLKEGIWYGFINNKETQITDPRTISQLMYNHRIDQGQLAPIKVEGNKETYVLSSDLNNPEVVVRNSTNNSIEVLSNENAVKAINSYQQELEDKRLKDAAEQALKTGNITLEDVNLDDDLENIQEQKPSSQKPAITSKTEPLQTQEDINKTGDKSLVELQGDQQLTTAESIIINDIIEGGSLLELIQSKFSELAQEDDLGKIIDFLKQKGIPVIGIQDKNAFIDNIENCK